MLALLFYSIISDEYTFSDRLELTKEDVKDAMKKHTNITDVIIENINKIGDGAFYYCEEIKSVSISSSVDTIGNLSFAYCSNLTKFSFDEKSKLTTIGKYAFLSCIKLKSISIPSLFDSIGQYAIIVQV